MKKYIFPVFTSVVIGTIMAVLLINSYDNKKALTVAKNVQTVYYIQRGVYSNKDSMKENMSEFESYIYNKKEGKYYTYIGMSQNKENAEKLKEYYKKQGYETIIKEKHTDNTNFLTVLSQYDKLLESTDNTQTINVICNQILSKYEELVNNEY